LLLSKKKTHIGHFDYEETITLVCRYKIILIFDIIIYTVEGVRTKTVMLKVTQLNDVANVKLNKRLNSLY